MNRYAIIKILTMAALGNASEICAQNRIRYEYYQSGNREYRKVIVLQNKSTIIGSESQEEEIFESQLGSREICIYPNMYILIFRTKGEMREWKVIKE